jgi:predicted nucleic-acid-binding Zn-ribbon protein
MGLFSAEEPTKYEIDNKQLICMFCKNETFHVRKEQLHSPTQSFFDVEWMGSTATCLVCSSCGYLHWFKR